MTPSPTDPALPPAPRPAGAGSGNAEPPPRLASRTAPAADPDPRPRGRGTQSSAQPAFPGTGSAAREEGPGAVLRPGAGSPPAQDPPRPVPDDTPASGPAGRGGSTWTIELPAGLKLLTANDRLHWAERNRIARSLKKAAWAMTINARIPRLQRVVIQGIYDPPDRRRRDGENLAPALKACIDGIVAAGRLADDDARHVVRVWCEIGDEPYPRGRLRLIIREVSG